MMQGLQETIKLPFALRLNSQLISLCSWKQKEGLLLPSNWSEMALEHNA